MRKHCLDRTCPAIEKRPGEEVKRAFLWRCRFCGVEMIETEEEAENLPEIKARCPNGARVSVVEQGLVMIGAFRGFCCVDPVPNSRGGR